MAFKQCRWVPLSDWDIKCHTSYPLVLQNIQYSANGWMNSTAERLIQLRNVLTSAAERIGQLNHYLHNTVEGTYLYSRYLVRYVPIRQFARNADGVFGQYE